MIISIPTIRKRHFKEMLAVYDAVANDYNANVKKERDAGDYTRNPLRSSHREVYIQLLNLLAAYFENQYIFLKDDSKRCKYMRCNAGTPPVVRTNRPQLSRRTKKSESSIYRQLLRLQEAGILSKRPHGPESQIEIIFNPDMVLISDENDLNFSPINFILQRSENQVVISCLRSFCTPYSNTRTFKNEVIQEHQKVSSVRPTFTTNLPEQNYRNTGSPIQVNSVPDRTLDAALAKINEFADNVPTSRQPQQPPGIKNAFGVVISPVQRNTDADKRPVQNAPKINEFDNHKQSYASKLAEAEAAYKKRLERYVGWFVSYVITVLYLEFGRKVYDGEKLNARQVAEWYFRESAYNSVKACDIKREELKRRVDIVRRQIDVGKWHPMVGPSWYLHPDNPSGFAKTSIWLKRDERYRECSRFNRLRNTNEAKLQAALDNVYRTNSIAVYESGLRYLQKAAPKIVGTYTLQAMTYFELQQAEEVVNYE